jgi:hypothetical protein
MKRFTEERQNGTVADAVILDTISAGFEKIKDMLQSFFARYS